MALVRDECLLPCKDAPELGYAKESSSEQYVPDVFYKVRAPRRERRPGLAPGSVSRGSRGATRSERWAAVRDSPSAAAAPTPLPFPDRGPRQESGTDPWGRDVGSPGAPQWGPTVWTRHCPLLSLSQLFH